jgi:MoaA/NifB/PqqE/SkfB family radical SAM enzyme
MENINFLAELSQRVNNFYQEGILPVYFKAPVFCLWEVTTRCDLSCIHCFYNANRKIENELTTDEALNIIEQLGRMKVFEVYLIGGEPLLRKDWSILVEKLRENKIQVGVITNGVRVNHDTARELARLKVKWVQVSVDGSNPQIHDRIRGVAGAWDKSIQAIQYLKEEGVRTYVSFVPSKINYRDIGNVVNLCVKMGIEYFLTDMLVLTGRAALNVDNIGLNAGEYSEFFALLEDAAKTSGEKIIINAPTKEKETIAVYTKSRAAMPNLWCIITPEGFCRLDILIAFTYGNLRKQSLQYVWDNFIRGGWKRPEVIEFVDKLNLMTDLVNSPYLPYVSEDIHYE